MAVTGNLPRYRYISRLGAGGMATVELAEDTVLDRLVALKRLSIGGEGQAVSRLRREALVGASISHPNLVSVYDVVNTQDGEVVIVMEYVEGETLAARLGREGRLEASETLRVLTDVAAALDAIHKQGIVHRDVKPPNILLGRDGAVKLADLGVASAPDRTRITSAGSVVGSFRYMAPEQLEEGPATPAIDIYALASVAFEMLSGRQAHQAPNPLALAHAISTQPPPDLRDAWPGASEDAARVLMMGMSRDPRDRPRSAADFVRRLRVALEPSPTVPLAPRERPAPRPAAAAAVAVTPRDAATTRSTPMPLAVQRRSRRRLLPVLLGLAAIAAAVIIILASSGGATHSTGAAARTRTHHKHHGGRAAAPATSTTASTTASSSSSPSSSSGSSSASTTAQAPAGSSTGGTTSSATAGTANGAPATGAASAATPVAATESFYRLAAAHQYSTAWALADPAFRSQLQGYDSFVAGQSADRSITFRSAHVVSQSASSASVAVQTVSVRADGTESCSGTVALVPGSGGWLLDQISINCTPS